MTGQSIQKDFVERTLHILENYEGPYGVTLLINCLLGLIVLPREKDFNHITEREGIRFHDLGLKQGEIRSWGSIAEGERTAARFLRCMRNAVAHIKIESISREGEIESLRFTDSSGFEAVFEVERLKDMAYRLSDFIREN